MKVYLLKFSWLDATFEWLVSLWYLRGNSVFRPYAGRQNDIEVSTLLVRYHEAKREKQDYLLFSLIWRTTPAEFGNSRHHKLGK